MSDFYCPLCNIRRVSREGEICSSCQDPYAQVSAPAAPQTPAPPSAPSPAQNSPRAEDDGGVQPTIHSGRRIIGAKAAPASAPSGARPYNPMAQQSAPVQQPVQQPVRQSVMAPAPGAVPMPPQGNAANTQTAPGTVTPITEGIVKNVINGKDKAGFVGRWLRSLLMGVPFARTDDITEFQVYSNWSGTSSNGGYSADKVVAYGNIVTGKPIQDNSVRVYGKRDKNRQIIAQDIENTTDGTYSVFDPRPMSATAVRIISVIVIALIVLLPVLLAFGLKSAGAGISGTGTEAAATGGGIGQALTAILVALIFGIVAFISGKRTVANFGQNWKNCGICALITLLAIFGCISMLGSIF